MASSRNKEVEIKFLVADVRALERKLRAAGFRRVTPRTHEMNVLYDTPEGLLRESGQLLRIRQYGKKWTLTHKAPTRTASKEPTGAHRTSPPFAALRVGHPMKTPVVSLRSAQERGVTPARHKTRIETETEVADGAKMDAILRALGFAPTFRYEKFRSEWTDDKGEVVVDETPIGNVAEIEGAPRWIDQTAKKLGVSRAEYIIKNYAQMFFDWKRRTGSKAEEMAFGDLSRRRGTTE